jgi:NADPH:quinone reductase-like Zn-dependent oxidoreductase
MSAPQIAKTMRGLGVRTFGKSDKLELLEVPVPTIQGREDIVVKVHAVGLNQSDTVRAGGFSRVIEKIT